MQSQVIYVESCPICSDGLCRIRVCIQNKRLTGVVLCDECEAAWTDPSMNQRILRAEDDNEPHCPDCHESLWGKQSHWASLGEVCLLGWFDLVHVVPRAN